MNISDLKQGDVFEVVRNGKRYEFTRFSIEVRPRDFFAKDENGKETSINLKTKIRLIKRK